MGKNITHRSSFNNIVLCLCLIGFLFPVSKWMMLLISVALITTFIFMVKDAVTEKNFPLFFISLFMSTYAYVPIVYIWGMEKYIISTTLEAESMNTVYMTALCLLTFVTVFHRNIKTEVPACMKGQKQYLCYRNDKGYWIVVFLSLICIVLGQSGETIFESGGYGQGNMESSSLYEYGIIFISLGLIYASTKKRRWIVYGLCLFFIVKNLMYGGRIPSLMLVLSVFMIRFINRFSFKAILGMCIVGYVFLQFWGYYRGHTSADGFQIEEDGNAAFVYYASMRIHYFIEEGIMSFGDRIWSFCCFMSAVIMPFSKLPEIANLSLYLQDEYYSGGGGLISTFIFCWLSVPGIILLAFFIGKAFNMFYYSNSIYKKYYALLLMVTVPRWFAYYPINIIKYCMYGMLAFYFINKFFITKSKSII